MASKGGLEIRFVGAEYPLHDKDRFLEFVVGMCHHTRELIGMATEAEAQMVLGEWPKDRRDQAIAMLQRRGLVQLSGSPAS